MILLPAIDLYEQKGVRLFKGQYDQMTVYTEDPVSYAHAIAQKGASWIHLVDLEGARDGTSPNLDIIRRITAETGLSVETGGGIRSFETIETLLGAGVKRVIIGTRAIEDEDFLKEALNRYGDAVAVAWMRATARSQPMAGPPRQTGMRRNSSCICGILAFRA